MRKIIIITPTITEPGGVNNYYKVLGLDSYDNIHYMFVSTVKDSVLGKITRPFLCYLIVFYKCAFKKIDIIHINPSLNDVSLFRESVFILIARFFNTKTVCFIRGWHDDFEDKIRKSSFLQSYFRLIFNKTDKIIVLGTVFMEKLQEINVLKNVDEKVLIETTIADDEFLDELDINKKIDAFNNPVVELLYLSRIIKSKGIFIALEAYKKISESGLSNYRFNIAGDGPDIELAKRYADEHNLSNVIFHGHVSGGKKGELLKKCHILVFSSYHEGLPNTVLEAMLHGMAIISTRVGSVSEIIENGKNGFLIEIADNNQLAENIKVITKDPTLFKRMSLLNNKLALQRFTKKFIKKRLLDIYESL
jgi:glycosyltransferase involved in cell wall biosynthesis